MFTFNDKTNDKVKSILTNANKSGQRLRIVYGDSDTGRDWLEENDVIGTIGKSTGNRKIPLLIANSRSYGGGSILDQCIVKIVATDSKRVLYQHDTYHQADLSYSEVVTDGYPHCVFADGKLHASFKSEKSALNFISFLQCNRMCK